MVYNKKRKPVFIKRKWNHVVFSRATILSFHPVNQMKMHKALQPRDNVDYLCYEKRKKKDSPALKIVWMLQYEE